MAQESTPHKKDFTDTQLLAAQLIAATFPGYYASHGQLVRAEQESVSITKRIIEIIKSDF